MLRRLIFLFMAFCTACELFSQQYPFVHYTPKDGLVNSRVRKAFQDSKGRMYFLTYGGLSVYDGVRFKNYTRDNGLGINMVNDIVEMGDDSILVALNSNDLHWIIRGKITPFSHNAEEGQLVNHFVKTSDGKLFATGDEGLFVYRNNKIEKVQLPIFDSSSILPFLGSIVSYREFLVFSTNDLRPYSGLFVYNTLTNTLVHAIDSFPIYFLGKDLNERIWLSTPKGVALLDSASLRTGTLAFDYNRPPFNSLKNVYVSDMEFEEKYVWINNGGSLIIRIGFDSKGRIDFPIAQLPFGVQKLYLDREKNVWLSNDGAGVFKMINAGLRVNDKLLEKNPHSAGNFNDTTWYSVSDHTIYRTIGNRKETFRSNISPAPMIFAQHSGRLYAVYIDVMYTATVPTAENKTIYFQHIGTIEKGNAFGKGSFLDPPNTLMLATANALLVWKDNRIISEHRLRPANTIEGLQIDTKGNLWMATRYEGLVRFKINRNNPSKYLEILNNLDTLKDGASPRSMVVDKNGSIWVGTRNDGILVYTLINDSLEVKAHLTRSSGLTDDFVLALACDSVGNIIVGTQTGLDRIIKVKGGYLIENITKSNNIFTFIRQVWVRNDNHTQALANTGALLEIAPFEEKLQPYVPKLFVEEFKVNGISLSAPIHMFRYNENNLSVSVAAPTFLDEKQVQYSYLLEGGGHDSWSEPSAIADIQLVNLSEGKYNLRVKATFPSTPYEPVEFSYPFEIVPPWWKTWMFRIPVIIFLIGCFAFALRFYYRRKLEKQQAIEKERTRIATDMHDDLGAGLSRIKFLSETIGLKKQQQQPIEEDISKIRHYAHEMIDKMGEIVWALNERNDSLNDLLSYTRSYAVEYLSQSGIACLVDIPDNVPQRFVSGEFRRNIFLAVKESLHNVVKHAQADMVSISVSVDQDLVIGISDNGIGFSKEKARVHGNGLLNISKRMLDLGGNMELNNSIGTTITLKAPLN